MFVNMIAYISWCHGIHSFVGILITCCAFVIVMKNKIFHLRKKGIQEIMRFTFLHLNLYQFPEDLDEELAPKSSPLQVEQVYNVTSDLVDLESLYSGMTLCDLIITKTPMDTAFLVCQGICFT